MPNVLCEQCKNLFFLNRKQYKYVLKEVPSFCSWICLTNYLLFFKPKHHNIKYCFTETTNITDLVYYPDINMSLRSKYEYKVALFLKNLGLDFEYEEYLLRNEVKKNVYIPDFYIPKLDLFIEVKGLWNRNARNKVKYWSRKVNLLVIPYYLQKRG